MTAGKTQFRLIMPTTLRAELHEKAQNLGVSDTSFIRNSICVAIGADSRETRAALLQADEINRMALNIKISNRNFTRAIDNFASIAGRFK